MKYVQVTELREGACDGCVHDDIDLGGYTEACRAHRGELAANQKCRDGIWIEDTDEARQAHALKRITQRLTQET